MSVIAKKKDNREQTLEEHTFAVIQEALDLIDEKTLDFISAKCNFSKERLRDLIFCLAYFHDLGKATEEFQNTIHAEKKSFHSLYSANLVSDIIDFELNEEEYVNMLLLVILTHHSLYNINGSFGCIDQGREYSHRFLPEAREFFESYKTVYNRYLKRQCVYKFVYRENNLEELNRIINSDLRDEIRSFSDYQSLRLLYAYLSGLLNLADWSASAKFGGTYPEITFTNVLNKEYILEKLKNALGIKEFIPKDFQQRLSDTQGNVLVEIPTGEGKTEGAFLWAAKNIRNKHSKIIYTLPTQTTSNKLFERAKAVYGNSAGLVHGSAEIYLETIYEEENGSIDENFKAEILYSKTFNKPMTISTIDGLLKYFMNTGRYNIATFNILNSVVIIDEIHSYDFKLLGFIKRFLELAQEYRIPVCIMSASIPDKIKEKLNIGHYPLIRDEKLFQAKAIEIVKRNDRMENNIDLIIEEYNKGKNVIVVRNLVRNSVRTFTELKQRGIENIILYNACFKKRCRIEKENEIYERLKSKKNFILVATQVVEISLDIDFDVMFTDVAPIDALIQRFGRVNRRKKADRIDKVYIFRETEGKPYEDIMLNTTFDIVEEGVHPIFTYNKWLNAVYDKVFEFTKIQNKASMFDEGYSLFDDMLKKSYGISKTNDNYDLRNIEFPKRDFLLTEDYDNGKTKYEDTVSLGSWLANDMSYLRIERNSRKGLYYDVLNLGYSCETGVQIPTNSKEELFI